MKKEIEDRIQIARIQHEFDIQDRNLEWVQDRQRIKEDLQQVIGSLQRIYNRLG